jgi:glycosyltransferase 2 family protein
MNKQIDSIIKSKKIYYFIFLVVLIYVILLFYADFNNIIEGIKKISFINIVSLFFLALAAHFMSFSRFRFILRNIGISVPSKNVSRIYLSCWSMFFAPAKSGELIKSFFLKKLHDVSYRKTAPIVFVEQFSDLIVVFLLSILGVIMFGIFSLNQVIFVFGFAVIIIISVIILLSSKKLVKTLLKFIAKIKLFKKPAITLYDMYLNAGNLIKPRILLTSIVYSFGFWFFMSMVLSTVLNIFDVRLILFVPISIFALSTLIGTLSFIPAGVGSMEASVLFLLIGQGVPKSIAVISIIITRLFTLWFGVLMGLFAMWMLNKKISLSEKTKALKE